MQTGTNIEKILGLIIRDLRIKKGLSQEKLAELGSFERSYISKVENGDRAIRVVTFIRFAHALNMTPEHLMKILQDRLNI